MKSALEQVYVILLLFEIWCWIWFLVRYVFAALSLAQIINTYLRSRNQKLESLIRKSKTYLRSSQLRAPLSISLLQFIWHIRSEFGATVMLLQDVLPIIACRMSLSCLSRKCCSWLHARSKLFLLSFILNRLLLLLLCQYGGVWLVNKITSTPKCPNMYIIGGWTSCQFFLLGLYVIKVLIAYSLLAYNIDFFKIVFNIFPSSRFLKYFSQTWLETRTYTNIVREERISHDWLVC